MKIRDIVLAGILSAATTAGKGIKFCPQCGNCNLVFHSIHNHIGDKTKPDGCYGFCNNRDIDLWFLHLGYRLLPYLAYAGFNCISPQQKGQL